MVVLEYRLIGLTVRGMFDPPCVEFLIENLLIKMLINLDPGVAVDRVLTQCIGLLHTQRQLGLIRGQLRLPQTGFTLRRDNGGDTFSPPAQRAGRDLADAIPGSGNGDANPNVDGHGFQMRPCAVHIPDTERLHAVIDLKADLQGHHGHHDLAHARNKKRRRIEHVHPQAGVILQAFAQ